MSSASNYLEAAICNLMRATSITAFTGYVALFDGDPGEAGSGATEVTTTVRVAGRLAVTWGAPSDGVMTNSAAVDFGAAAGATTIAGYGIYDAASAGNLIAYAALASTPVAAGANVSFAIGALSFTVA